MLAKLLWRVNRGLRLLQGWLRLWLITCFKDENETVQGINNTFPVVLRPSSCRCASAASRSGNVFSILSFNSPDLIQLKRSPARQSSSSRVAAYCARLGRVKKSEPFCASSAGSKSATGPLDWPKSASIPRGASEDRLFKNVSRPTES